MATQQQQEQQKVHSRVDDVLPASGTLPIKIERETERLRTKNINKQHCQVGAEPWSEASIIHKIRSCNCRAAEYANIEEVVADN